MSIDLKTKREQVTCRLTELLARPPLHQERLYEAAKHALVAGKRLRPIMLLLAVETLGYPLELALNPACAIECVHTYSLIHDDLPCMDDDDFRRGRPTAHRAYGEGLALLAGDFLLTYAFDLLAHAPHLSPTQKNQLTQILSRRAGGRGMIAGQVVDLASEGKVISRKTLYFMHFHKTASLIIACFECAAILASASPSDQKILLEFGKRLGLAYQIADDIFDAAEENGQKNSDLKKEKATAVTVFGLAKAKELLEMLHLSALAKLQKLSKPAPLLHSLANHLLERSF